MKRKPTERERLTRAMEHMGLMDTPGRRHFLCGDQIELWERDCACAEECSCWELAGRRPATAQEREAFLIAQRPDPPRPQQAPAPAADPIAEVAARAQSAPRWRPLFGKEDAA